MADHDVHGKITSTWSDDDRWTGTGELGLALSRGNSRSENLNAKLAFGYEDDRWTHSIGASALRAKGEVSGDYDGDGVTDLAVFDSKTGQWFIADTLGQAILWGGAWGFPGAVPVGGFR